MGYAETKRRLIDDAGPWARRPAEPWAIALSILAATLMVPVLMLATPGAYLAAMPHDSLSMADIGYRLASGQNPGRDFHSAFGVLFQAQMAWAYMLGPRVSQTLEYATVLFFLFSAPIAAYLAHTRLSNIGAVAVVFAALIVGGAPYAKADHNLAGATFAMLYNREGWVLLLFLALLWLPRRRPVRAWLEGPLIGLLTAAALYLKISYGGVALLICLQLALTRPSMRPALIYGAVTAILIALMVELTFGLGFNIAYLTDILTVAQVGGSRLAHILLNLFDARYELAIACLFVPLWSWRAGSPRRQELGFVLFMAAASVLIVWQNAQVEGLMLLWAGLAAMLEGRLAQAEQEPAANTTASQAIAIYAAWSVLTLSPSILVLGQYAVGSLSLTPLAPEIPAISDLRFQVPREDQKVRGAGAVYGDEYVASLRDGIAILSACPAGGRVLTLDLFEPFSQLTLRPANHGWSWHDPGHSFSRLRHPAADAEFAGVDCVMIPRHPTKGQATSDLLAIYGDYLEHHFTLTRTSPGWTLRIRQGAR